MTATVYKIQLPINPPNGHAMIYPQSRVPTVLVDQSLLPVWVIEVTRQAKNLKAYFSGTPTTGAGCPVEFHQRVPDEDW